MILNKGLSDTQHKEVRQVLDAQVQENLGMAMMYTLCEAVREYLVENNREGNVSALALAVGIGCSEHLLTCSDWRDG